MDAIKYFEERERMCKTYPTCEGCPLEPKDKYDCIKDSVKAVPIVEKWAEEHPQKTMLQDLLEKYPHVKLCNDGTPKDICPDSLGYCRDIDCFLDEESCIACWNRPIE